MPHDPAEDPTTPEYADRMLQRGRDAHRAGEPLVNSQHIGHDRGEMLWRTGWYLAAGDATGNELAAEWAAIDARHPSA